MPEQENKGRIASFNLSLGACDVEVAEWFLQQPNKGAYLKSLILADKENHEGTAIYPKPTKYDLEWEAHYELLKEFCELFGRLPAYAETYKEFRLGRWLHETTRRSRVNRPDRIEKLKSVGIVNKWERNYALVQGFRDAFGRLPDKNEFFRGVNIGAWLNLQVTKLRKEHHVFTQEQQEKLYDLGIFVSDWDKKFNLLKDFMAEYHRPPKYEEVYREIHIGRWLAYQRKALKPHKHADRIKSLKQIGAINCAVSKTAKIQTKA